MSFSSRLFSVILLSLPVFSSAQDTSAVAADSAQWFSDANSAAVGQNIAVQEASQGGAVFLDDSAAAFTIVVTASRRQQSSEWISEDHTVIDADRQARNTSETVFEMLEGAVPARMSDWGGGTVKTVSLMGAGSERTLVLVDGKRVGTTAGDIGDLQPSAIETIEVIEGGQSAQYGMDAVGGVVNVITSRPATERWTGRFSATAGTYEPDDNRPRLNSQNYQLALGRKKGRIGTFSAMDVGLSDGRYDYSDSGDVYRRGYNGFRDLGFCQKLWYMVDDLSFGASLGIRDRRADNPGTTIYPDSGTTKKNLGYLVLNGDWRTDDRLRLRASAALSLDNVRYEPVSTLWSGPSNHAYMNGDVEVVQEFTFGNQLLTTGVQGIRQSVRSSELGFRVAGQGSAFASAVLSHMVQDVAVRFMPAVRFDYSSVFNGALNGRLGLMATLKREVEPSLFANIGNSYRSPTFSDLYWPADMFSRGNPDLKRERSVDMDGGVIVRARRGGAAISNRLSIFLLRLDDMILWAPLPDYTWTPKNVDNATIAGLKYRSEFRYSEAIRASFDYVYSNARKTGTDTVLIYRPRHVAVFTNSLSAWRVTAGFSLRYSGEVFADEANTRELPASVTANMNLGVMVVGPGSDGGGIRLVYDIFNVTNEDHFLAEGYPLPKREHRLSLKADF